MGGGGGKGGESKQSIDPRLADAAASALDRAGEASKIPYSPNRGVTIAAFTPQQVAAMRGTSDASAAFGIPGGASPAMPTPETNAAGIRGYSTGAIYDEMKNKSMSPALQAAIDKFFIDRNTGADPAGAGAGAGDTQAGKPASGFNPALMNKLANKNIHGKMAMGAGK